MKTKLLFGFLAFLLVFLLLLMALITVSEPAPGNAGQVHSQFQSLLVSGGEAASQQAVPQYAFLFGLCFILFMMGCLAVGGRINNRFSKFHAWILAFLVTYLGIYGMLCHSYYTYIQHPENAQMVLGFPAPTAWMLYGIWFLPFLFSLVYLFQFDKFVLRPGDLERFKSLVNKKHQ